MSKRINIFKFNRGFTIVELLVVIAIMGVLGLIFTDTILQSLRGQNKVKVINQVKENGQVILDQIIAEVRQADRLVCPADSSDSMAVKTRDRYTRFRLYRPAPQANPPVSGYLARYDFKQEDLPRGFSPESICSDSSWGQSQETKISDSDPINGVSLNSEGSSPVFQRLSKPGFSDVLNIRFNAEQGVGAGQSMESRSRTTFATAVEIRNIGGGL